MTKLQPSSLQTIRSTLKEKKKQEKIKKTMGLRALQSWLVINIQLTHAPTFFFLYCFFFFQEDNWEKPAELPIIYYSNRKSPQVEMTSFLALVFLFLLSLSAENGMAAPQDVS